MQLGAPQSRHPVVERAAHQLVGEPVGEPRRGYLLDHPVRDRLLEGGGTLVVGQPGLRDRTEVELRSGDGGQLQQPRGGGAQPGEPLAHDLSHALRAPQSRPARALIAAPRRKPTRVSLSNRVRHSSVIRNALPPVSSLQKPGDFRQIRRRVVADRPLDELADLLGAQTAQAQPHHAFRAAQVDQRGRRAPRAPQPRCRGTS